MFVKVHKPVNTPCVCNNKDRCRALVEYLLKESLEDKPYYDTFFSHEEDYVPPVTVMQKIDNNHKKTEEEEMINSICCPSIPHRMKRLI